MNRMRSRLMQLFADNDSVENALRIENAGDSASIFLYAPIGGYFGVDAEMFARELNAIGAPNITIRMNSPGGDVFDGRAMASAIRQHPAKITCMIDGLCASAATYVANACRDTKMMSGSFYMIHNGWTMTVGDAAEHRKSYELLGQIDTEICKDYMRKTGCSADQVTAWMNAETWFNAEDACKYGFCNGIADLDTDSEDPASDPEDPNNPDDPYNSVRANQLARLWNLSAYANAPRFAAPQAKAPARPDIAAMVRRLELRERLIP